MNKIFFFLAFISLFFVSCTSDETGTEVDLGFEYAPLNEGSWIEYKLDSTIYNDFNNTVTTKEYLLRIEMSGFFQDAQGDNIMRVKRYIKPWNSSQSLQLEKTWFAKEESNRYETFEENLHFVKLVFPPADNKSWDGNIYITPGNGDNPLNSTRYYQDWDYYYDEVDGKITINDREYGKVAKVNQHDEVGGPGAIQHLVSYEWYGYGIGLIKKRMEMVVENCGAPNCSEKNLPVLERTKGRKGYILDMEILNYYIQN